VDRNTRLWHGVRVNMRTSFGIRVLAVLCVSIAALKGASACSCGSGFHSKNSWENAKQEAQVSTAIFEGTPIRFDLKWRLLSAKDGELIPADMYSDPTDLPSMVVTFQVQRTYKGSLGSEVQIHTGVGGGDCGAIYASGLNYLIFAGGPSQDQLGVSVCDPGGWIGDERVETELRYLRNEHPIAQDLESTRWWWARPNAAQIQEQWKRAAEERRKRYDAATGRICGVVTHPHQEDEFHGTIDFLSTQGSYPSGPFESSISADGSFCSPDLGPGKYYLYFVHGSEHGLAEGMYYPGVLDRSKAVAIEVAAGQMVSDIHFQAVAQSTHSVRGILFFSQKPDLHANNFANDVKILLIRTDGDQRVWYSENAEFISPRIACFKFDNVLPGQYAASALMPTSGWMTKKADVDVTSFMKFVYLNLSRKK
jgi:hypothetical protein